MLPQFLMQSFSNLSLGWLGDCRLEGFTIGGQGFVQVTVNVLDGVKKVILDWTQGKNEFMLTIK